MPAAATAALALPLAIPAASPAAPATWLVGSAPGARHGGRVDSSISGGQLDVTAALRRLMPRSTTQRKPARRGAKRGRIAGRSR